jgi:hypothetical protein
MASVTLRQRVTMPAGPPYVLRRVAARRLTGDPFLGPVEVVHTKEPRLARKQP